MFSDVRRDATAIWAEGDILRKCSFANGTVWGRIFGAQKSVGSIVNRQWTAAELADKQAIRIVLPTIFTFHGYSPLRKAYLVSV